MRRRATLAAQPSRWVHTMLGGFLTFTLALANGCFVTTSDGDDGGGGSDDDDDAETCTVENVDDLDDCDADCDVAVEGEDGISQCTTSCALDDEDCPSGSVCIELADGTGACLSSCDDGDDCGDDELCDEELDVCLPGAEGDTDDECSPSNVDDLDDCDADCDVAIEGDSGVYECTVTCDVDAQDCDLVGQYCIELSDGSGACLDDCAGSNVCPDANDVCDPDLFVCLPDVAD